VVNEDGTKGFLKAFDYSDANKSSDQRPSELIRNITNSFEYERKILIECSVNGLNNVVRYLDSGGIEVNHSIKYPRVEYLILEHADEGDIRVSLKNEYGSSLAWKLRSLHQITKSVSQLHRIFIAHQDIKPSNVVTFDYSNTKLTDMGSAVSERPIQSELPKYLEEDYCGSYEYSPPELLYGFIVNDFQIRRLACDLYLLGNMVVYYFMDVSMNFLLKSNLDRSLSWEKPTNYQKYDYIKPYLIEAFEKSMEDLKNSIEQEDLKEPLEEIVRFLCNPDPFNRGHIKNLNQKVGRLGLARFVTMFDRLAKKYELIEGLKY
jgi:serine/threonine protein kinase